MAASQGTVRVRRSGLQIFIHREQDNFFWYSCAFAGGVRSNGCGHERSRLHMQLTWRISKIMDSLGFTSVMHRPRPTRSTPPAHLWHRILVLQLHQAS